MFACSTAGARGYSLNQASGHHTFGCHFPFPLPFSLPFGAAGLDELAHAEPALAALAAGAHELTTAVPLELAESADDGRRPGMIVCFFFSFSGLGSLRSPRTFGASVIASPLFK